MHVDVIIDLKISTEERDHDFMTQIGKAGGWVVSMPPLSVEKKYVGAVPK